MRFAGSVAFCLLAMGIIAASPAALAQEGAETPLTGPTTATAPLLTTAIAPTTTTTPAMPYVGTVLENVGVMDRRRPAYDAIGIPVGAFRLYPTMDFTSSFDDNVFRQPNGVSDWFFTESPTVRLMSEWERHFLEVYGGLDNYDYASNGRLSLTDWILGTDGRLDIVRGAFISGMLSYGEQHESLQSPNTLGSQYSPNRYYKTDAEVTAAYQRARVGVELGGSFDRYAWMSTPLIGGGRLDNADRNEDEYQAYAKFIYDFSPGYTGFVKTYYDSRVFDRFYDRGDVHRSSTGYRVNGGVDLQLSNLLSGEIYAGYLEQHYAQDVTNPLRSAAGIDFGSSLNWYTTPRLTVHLNAWHVLTDVTIVGSSASSDEAMQLSADYEMLYNVILQGYFGYTHSKFIGLDRTDQYPSAGIAARYLVNRYLSAKLSYDFSERSSSQPVDFDDNMISITLTGHV